MAVATPVLRPKQSDRLAATLYSPPETCTSKLRALRNGMIPGSRRWTSAPTERKSRAQGSMRICSPLMETTFRIALPAVEWHYTTVELHQLGCSKIGRAHV